MLLSLTVVLLLPLPSSLLPYLPETQDIETEERQREEREREETKFRHEKGRRRDDGRSGVDDDGEKTEISAKAIAWVGYYEIEASSLRLDSKGIALTLRFSFVLSFKMMRLRE